MGKDKNAEVAVPASKKIAGVTHAHGFFVTFLPNLMYRSVEFVI